MRNLDISQSEGWSQHPNVEKTHERIASRNVIVNHRVEWMSEEIRGKWKNLNSLIMVEIRYYISSLKSIASEQQQHIRQHKSIENACHWVLDIAFRDDHNQTYQGNAAKNQSTVRRIVMNLLKIDKTYNKSTPKKRMRALMDKK